MSQPMSQSQNVSSAASNAATDSSTGLKRASNDMGWEYGILVDPTNLDKIQCKLCGKIMSSGISRLKKHIAQIKGSVSSCPSASKEDIAKCKAAVEEGSKKKKDKLQEAKEIREEVTNIEEDGDDEEVDIVGTRKRPHTLGPMDKYVSDINPGKKTMGQQTISATILKARIEKVDSFLARWVYEAGIPFHAIDNNSFAQFCEAVGQFGVGYQPPSQYKLREPLLKAEVERTKKCLKKQEEEWASTGCSIMTDAWSDRKRRSIMNLCVNCKEGTTFLSSKETSDESHTGEYIFNYVDKCIEEVGPKNVVQVVTDNASNNMAAAELLKIKRPNIFWSSCATHTINLMLEGIGKLPKFKGVIEKAKAFTIFIYAHHTTLAFMRKATKKRDIVRPGVTRFATSFLTLQSLAEKKEALKGMVTSNEWGKSKWGPSSTKGKTPYATVLSISFWNGVSLCLKVFAPLVKVLRLVDGDRPSMGFVYGELQKAKQEIIEACQSKEAQYKPILEIIDAKAQGRLDSPLHLTAYLLNPFYFYKDQTIQNDSSIMEAVIECVERFYPEDVDAQGDVINKELLMYKNKVGMFGKIVAAKGCEANNDNYDPVGWWSNYGNSTPKLQRMAMRILALTSSSSGCERNWSTFEGIHTKKRNRLDATRMSNLVYVQFNAKLINKKARRKEKDVLLASEATYAQGWIVEGGDDDEVEPGSGLTYELLATTMGVDEVFMPRRSGRNVRVREPRELHEEDFVSEDDSEEEENEEIDFESDGDQVLEGYGGEEIEEGDEL
ncbi:hypothetical protein RHMOL_Rhmol08G0170100 [Rhododendron molle]|uniref:Uncharacterized protein n=1 Tax=Rhododendron molle TaxID=49168 RepID=A0ACC0MQR8_RHOML|nr:hypothetical protein RHMOL_Rhmol08G0170100 [Rhododendron molle]